MSIIDRAWAKLTCPVCKTFEVSCVTDHGSGWGGPDWGCYGAFSDFVVEFKDRPKMEPDIVTAHCKKCGAKASVKEAYGMEEPKDL